VIGSYAQDIDSFNMKINQEFEMTDLSKIAYFLGLEILYTSKANTTKMKFTNILENRSLKTILQLSIVSLMIRLLIYTHQSYEEDSIHEVHKRFRSYSI
jgi:hypothetical protein